MPVKFKSEVSLDALGNATIDTDKFLVSDSGIIKYRTGTELLSDLGVSGIYVPYTGATQNVNLGSFDITANHLIKNGGVSTQFLKADGSVDNNVYLTSANLPSTLDLFATTTASDVPGYSVLVRNITDSRFNTIPVDVSTGVITTTAQLVGSLISDANIISGNPGIFNITTLGNISRTAGTGQAEFFFRVYKRSSAGVETFITESSKTLPVTNGGYTEFSATALWNNGIFLDTDRIVLKYYADRLTNPVGSNPTYNFQFGGISPVRSVAAVPVAVLPNIYLKDLADVEDTDALNNEILYWNSTSNLWEHSYVINLLSPASSTVNGYLSSTDWTAFNGKIGGSGIDNYIPRFNGTSSLENSLIYDSGTNIGIGTTTPVKLLDVAGDALINGLTVGRGSGNISSNTATGVNVLYSNTTGDNNIATGFGTLFNNTTGKHNTATGASVLQSNTTGRYNTATGSQALLSNNTGGGNTATGFEALFFNTTGIQNVANGFGALYNNTTGGNNIATGVNSGRYIANGITANTITNNSIYLGYNTKALADNQTNQIVIGYNATGLGSNTTVLGNASTVTTAIYGNVGIGTTSPTAKLEVAGDVGLRASALGLAATQILVTSADPASTTRIVQTRTPVQLLSDIGAQPLLTNPITGTGTTNYLPKFTGASALGNSLIYDNGSNVYLNASSGTYRFEANAGNSQYINARFYGSSHSLLQIESTTAGFQALLSFTSPTRTWSTGLQGDGRFNIYDNTANAERFTITSSGNVGIGTTSPDSTLTVNGTGSSQIRLRSNDGNRGFLYVDGTEFALGTSTSIPLNIQTNGSTKMTVTSGGNVGIGTSSPSTLLHVNGSITVGTGANLRLSSNSNEAEIVAALNKGIKFYTNDGNSNPLNLTSTGNVGIGTTSPSEKLSVNGDISIPYGNSLKASGGFVQSKYIWSSYTGGQDILNFGVAGAYGGYGTDNTTPRLVIAQSGNVGIGTTSPAGKLSILDGYYNTFFADTSSQYGSGLILSGDAGSDQRSWKTFVKNGNGGVAMTFETSTNGTAYGNNPIGLTYSEKMRITPSGNVGIGTTAPSFPLSLGMGLGNKIGLYDAASGTGYGFGIQASLLQVFANTSADDITFGYGNSTTLIRNVTFKGTGNVGIGTTSPTAIGTNITTLDIKGSSGGGVRSGVAGGSESTFYTIAAGGYLGTISNIPLNFQTNNSVKATILASGNVGIGTTDPTAKLHVVGLKEYATNALAIAAGLTKGAFYHTGGVVKVVI